MEYVNKAAYKGLNIKMSNRNDDLDIEYEKGLEGWRAMARWNGLPLEASEGEERR